VVHHRKIGIVLLNMGGPDCLADVRPFLFNLFSDREIIQLGPRPLQKPIAWCIARRRAPKSMTNYAVIGGASPLKAITLAQAEALAEALRHEDDDYHVTIAMRYWHPFPEVAIAAMLNNGVTDVVLLPLYPHYSKATSGSSLNHFRQTLAKIAPHIPVSAISSYPTNTLYVEAVAANINQGLSTLPGSAEIIYSAHSLPTSFIRDGDPYVDHLQQTIAAVEEITGRHGRLCFQSRSGPVEWLTPSTPDMIRELARENCQEALIVPLSFVSDHIETLVEIDRDYKALARSLGITLHRSASLNTHPLFINALKSLVVTAGWR
jgi:ferrochelatase